MTEPYGKTLASVHDAGFSEFVRSVAPEVIDRLAGMGVHRGTLVDIGCGSGISSRIFSRAGFDVLGIDASPAMIRLARTRAPGASFRATTYERAMLPRAEAVVALGEVLNYTSDPASHSARVGLFFSRAHAALAPDGVLLFDVALYRESLRIEGRSWYDGDGWLIAVERELDRGARVLTRHVTTFHRLRGHWERSVEAHRQYLFRKEELMAALRQAGFRVSMRRSFERFQLPDAHAVFICRRPGRAGLSS